MKYLTCFLLTVVSAFAAVTSPGVTLQTRAGYDSNPVGTSGTSAAVLGDEGTLTLGLGVGAGLKLALDSPAKASLKIDYTFDATRFDRRESEDYSNHRLALGGGFEAGRWVFTGDASSLFVDGERETLTAVPTVNANAITLWRERRQQWQQRAKLQAQAFYGNTLVRVGAKALAYDYQTRVKAGKVAFADRSDVQVAGDLGWKQSADSLWLAGMRAGHQEQAKIALPGGGFDYTNDYTRLALGWEGKPLAGTSMNFAAGPDFRRYTGTIDPVTFTGGRERTSLWFEGGFASKLSDTLKLTGNAARMAWLSSTGKAAYYDTSADLALSCASTPDLTLRFSAKVHRCDYFPSVRDDGEYLVGPGATYKLSKHTTLTLDILKHQAWNHLSAFPERDFQRLVVTAGAGVKF